MGDGGALSLQNAEVLSTLATGEAVVLKEVVILGELGVVVIEEDNTISGAEVVYCIGERFTNGAFPKVKKGSVGASGPVGK